MNSLNLARQKRKQGLDVAMGLRLDTFLKDEDIGKCLSEARERLKDEWAMSMPDQDDLRAELHTLLKGLDLWLEVARSVINDAQIEAARERD